MAIDIKKKDGITEGIEVLVKRTDIPYNDTDLNSVDLEFGEPLYLKTGTGVGNPAMVIGDGVKDIKDLSVFKSFKRDVLDKLVFYNSEVGTTVGQTEIRLLQLIEENGNLAYPLTKQWTTIDNSGVTNAKMTHDGTWYKVDSTGITGQTTTTPPMAQYIPIEGITSDFQVMVCNILSNAERADKQTSKNKRKAFGCITDVQTYNGGICVICSNKQPKASCNIHAFGGFTGKRSIVIGGSGSAFDQTGSSTQFVYVNTPEEGEDLVASTATVGSGIKPIWMNGGFMTASSSSVGGETASGSGKYYPVYLNNGEITSLTGTLANNCSGTASKVSWTNATGSKEINIAGTDGTTAYYNTGVKITTKNVLKGAAWNDYAEFRCGTEKIPGMCLFENTSGVMHRTNKRLQKGCYISTDTFGMIVGKDDENAIPVSVAGRVLAHIDGSKFEVGDAVCSGKNGTVSKMSRLEIILFPDRIVGYVSEIPDYEEWNGVSVCGRIWIRVK